MRCETQVREPYQNMLFPHLILAILLYFRKTRVRKPIKKQCFRT